MPAKGNLPLIQVFILVSGLDIGGAHGGAERFGLELCRHLPRDEFDARLVAFWKHGTTSEDYWLDRLVNSNIPVVFAAEWTGNFSLRGYRAGIDAITRSLGSSKPVDIFHSHYQMGTLAAIVLKTRGLTRVAMRTAHVSREWGFGFSSWVMRQLFTNWIYPLLLDQEVGVSQAIVDTLQHHPGNRLTRKSPRLLHNAIYPELFTAGEGIDKSSSEIGLQSHLVLGSIGRMTAQKGYHYLLAAMPRVVEKLPEVQLILIGDGELRPKLEQQARQLGISSSVSFLGQKEDVRPYLGKFDLFVLPSIYEGLPTVILESMACGVPVLATDIPGTRELIQDGYNGWLVESKDSAAMAEALVAALSSPQQREQMARRARLTVEDFRIEKIAGQYADLYSMLVRKKLTTEG